MDKENQASRQPLVNRSIANKDKCNKTPVVCVPWQNQRILVVDSLEKCQTVVKELELCCKQYGVLGIGCDFVSKRNDIISLLLLSTFDGLCALIRLDNIKRSLRQIPPELEQILEDESIVKVGVDVVNVCKKLTKYNIFVANILDLRYLAAKCNFQIGHLSALSAIHLDVKLSENNRLDQRHWYKLKTSELDENDQIYAAMYVRASIELFKVFKKTITNSDSTNDVRQFINVHCSMYLNKFYKNRISTENEATNNVQGIQLPKQQIEIIKNMEHFQFVLRMLREQCNKYKMFSFCCYKYHGTAVALGLASYHGMYMFVQFRRIQTIPDDLRTLLEDENIVKVGVNVFGESDRLKRDYGFAVASILDLRHLAKECTYRPVELGQMSKEHLHIDLDEDDWRIPVTDWKDLRIRNYAVNQAAKRLQVSVELFKVFKQKLEKNHWNWSTFVAEICQPYLNEDYPMRKAQHFTGQLPEQDVRVVNNHNECKVAVQELRTHCEEYNVLGFDCEWHPYGRQKVSLLQLATHRGLCVLIRLCKLKEISSELRELMMDKGILKVGISPHHDAKKLRHDYKLIVRSTLDLVPLAKKCRYKAKGLAGLSEEVLHVQLTNKKRGLLTMKLHKKWNEDTLSRENIDYAANDVHVSIELFRKIEEKLTGIEMATDDNRLESLQKFIDKHCLPHLKNK